MPPAADRSSQPDRPGVKSAVLEIDGAGRIAHADEAAAALLAEAPAHLTGRSLDALLADRSRDQLPALLAHLGSRDPTWSTLWMRVRSGTRRLLVRIVPVRAHGSNPTLRLELRADGGGASTGIITPSSAT